MTRPKHKPGRKKPLTPKQSRFVDEYLIDLNATQAAVRAKYNKATANKTGPRLLVNVGVAGEIARRVAERAKAAEVDANYVLLGLKREAAGLNPDTTAASRVRALELLGKHLGLFRDERQPVVVVQPAVPTTPPVTQAEKVAAVERIIKLAQERMAAGQLPAAPPAPTEQPLAG